MHCIPTLGKFGPSLKILSSRYNKMMQNNKFKCSKFVFPILTFSEIVKSW